MTNGGTLSLEAETEVGKSLLPRQELHSHSLCQQTFRASPLKKKVCPRFFFCMHVKARKHCVERRYVCFVHRCLDVTLPVDAWHCTCCFRSLHALASFACSASMHFSLFPPTLTSGGVCCRAWYGTPARFRVAQHCANRHFVRLL